MLQAEYITKTFKRKHGEVIALDQVSLKIEKGEFIAITGPSGSGKSTLLLALGGMSSPSKGAVLFEKNSVYNWDVNKRAKWRASQIGFVFQSFNLIPYLTVYENVGAGLALAGEKNISDALIIPLLEQMKIADRKDHLPSELSVGQQQRVALARALIKNPNIIFADEPTGNLDPETGKEIMQIITKQHQEGRTVVVITHDPQVAHAAGRIIRIAEGRIVEY
ncbi:MAG: ABC transporter ATP-binding protein [Candidatus Cloacimonetes bacterium]|nr:ABC transporter ATP-binding protein [Candidatus Cloacimonadota bacterium]